ncbi:type 1 glutamine amidotransferase domain-containing protein [Ekhidna sp.]|uniref:type 1 glutamine amidotransferase domain-containing protein n=1 Tax=Ekhidna sp. TaxID=2608089 RepID=UPI003B5BCFCD
MKPLEDVNVAILSEDGFEESELTSPKEMLETSGANVTIVSPRKNKIRSWKDDNWNMEISVDKQVQQTSADDYDALLIPGGVANPDLLRVNEDTVAFVSDFFEAGKPIASICHGPQVLIETGALNGRMMTSYPSIKTDLKNAGAQWVDKSVVVDAGLVTSRSPEDLEDFNAKMIEEFAEGVHENQKTI